MDIQLEHGCSWGLGSGLPMVGECESELDNLIVELMGGTCKSSTAESQAGSPGLLPGLDVVGGQPTGADPFYTAVSDGSSADVGDWWRSNIVEDGSGSPFWDVFPIDEERGTAENTVCEPLLDAIQQHDSSFPLSWPQPAEEQVQGAGANSPSGDLSQASARGAAETEVFVGKRKRRSSNEALHSSATKKPCRGYVAQSLGGTDAQWPRSATVDAPGHIVVGAQLLDEQVSDTTASTPETGTDEAHKKRQLRLIRNRESASESRARKKCYLKELEIKCRYLEGHCTSLQQAIHHTAMENLALREELERARKHNGTICSEAEPAALESDSLPSESLPRRTYPCLMANLLSFLIVGLCHEWLGRVFLAMFQITAETVPREGSELVPTFHMGGTVGGAGALSWDPRLNRPRPSPAVHMGGTYPGYEYGDSCGKKKRLWNSTIRRARVKFRAKSRRKGKI